MYDAGPVRVVEPLAGVAGDPHGVVGVEHPVLSQEVRARGTFDVLHDDEVTPGLGVLAGVEHLDDVGVLELRRGQRLPSEARDEGLVLRQVLGQELHRHRPLEHSVPGAEDRRHAARAESVLELVAPCDCRWRGHQPPPLPSFFACPGGTPPLGLVGGAGLEVVVVWVVVGGGGGLELVVVVVVVVVGVELEVVLVLVLELVFDLAAHFAAIRFFRLSIPSLSVARMSESVLAGSEATPCSSAGIVVVVRLVQSGCLLLLRPCASCRWLIRSDAFDAGIFAPDPPQPATPVAIASADRTSAMLARMNFASSLSTNQKFKLATAAKGASKTPEALLSYFTDALVGVPFDSSTMAELMNYLRATGPWTGSDVQLQAKAPGLVHLIAGSPEYQFV